MISDLENRLDRAIDQLNQERAPSPPMDDEEASLLAVARLLKGLREPCRPQSDFERRLLGGLKGAKRKRFGYPAAAVAAGILLLVLFSTWSWLRPPDVVLAMERAVRQLENYHGILEKRAINADGDVWVLQRTSIWSEGDRYALKDDDGVLTVSNGEKRWQVVPEEKRVALLPLLPDARGFDLRDEAERASKYPHEVVGREIIAGREAVHLQISPPGGKAYSLWIDSETNLPLQLRTAMQHALQVEYTFVVFEPNTEMPAGLFDFRPPAGYQVVEDNPGEIVATPAEAAEIAGFTPLLPEDAPQRMMAFEGRIILEYERGFIVQTRVDPDTSFEPAAHGALGRAAGSTMEVLPDSLRWRQGQVEVQVRGEQRVALARQLAPDLEMPDADTGLADQASVKVPVDLEVVRNQQMSVDAGSSPWWLDPLQVAHTFVSLQMSPEGIQGEGPIRHGAFHVAVNNGVEAIVEVETGPVARVYLKRLVREDETGIWWVVGYDPADG